MTKYILHIEPKAQSRPRFTRQGRVYEQKDITNWRRVKHDNHTVYVVCDYGCRSDGHEEDVEHHDDVERLMRGKRGGVMMKIIKHEVKNYVNDVHVGTNFFETKEKRYSEFITIEDPL